MNWFQRLGAKINNAMKHFMLGRYGTDKLNTYLLGTAVVLCLLAMFIPWALVRLAMAAVTYGLMFLSLFRCFSRNTYKRYEENRRFLRWLDRIKDRDHRYFDCPRCHQTVRVPRGKGKISITCPKCRERFERKT